jgi:hypothetical protein
MNHFPGPKGSQGVVRHPGDVIESPDILAGALMLLAVAVFAAMIWAGGHQH